MMAAQTDNYSMLTVLGRGYEIKITVNGQEFTLVKNGSKIIVSTTVEQHSFVGCHESEIKQALEEYHPGAWRKPAWE